MARLQALYLLYRCLPQALVLAGVEIKLTVNKAEIVLAGFQADCRRMFTDPAMELRADTLEVLVFPHHDPVPARFVRNVP